MSEVKGIFLTHAHPDHIGGAAEIKRITDCKVYAPMLELDWIEDIDIRYRERPIPNFYKLLKESVKVDVLNPLVVKKYRCLQKISFTTKIRRNF